MTTSKIQTNDRVKIISGRYKGQMGTITGIYTKTRKNGSLIKRVMVSDLPLIADYQRAYLFANQPGQMLSKPRSLDASNVQLINQKDEASKIRVEKKEGYTVRVFKKSGAVVTKVAKTAKAEKAETTKAKKTVKKETTDKKTSKK